MSLRVVCDTNVLVSALDLAGERPAAPERVPDQITGDPADDVILTCAVEAAVDVVVSGDRRHLLGVGEHRGVRIVTPQALLAELRGGDRL